MAGNFYYVDSVVDTDGLGNSYASDQVGNSFATLSDTNVYGSIQQAMTDGASDDDDIICADSHAFTTAAASITYTGGVSKALRISCATAADCGVRSTGASETTTSSTNDILLSGLITIDGINITSYDRISMTASGSTLTKSNGSCTISGLNQVFANLVDGTSLKFIEETIDFDDNTTEFLLGNGSTIEMIGGVIISTGDTTVDHIIEAGFNNGGSRFYATGTNLSAVIGTLIKGVGGSLLSDDMIDVRIDKCPLASGVDFHNETFKSINHKILVTQSSSDSTTAEYQHYYHTRGGTVEQATNIWRDESTAYYLSGQKVSWQAIGNSDAEVAMPFTFDFPTRTVALSGAAATDVIRIYLAVINTTTLYDDDVWATLVYPDGTTKNVFHSINSLATPSDNPTDIFRTPAVLPTDTGSTWKDSVGDLTGYNEYYMDLDTSSDAGEDCVPKIVMHVALQLAAGIYFDTSVGVVSS